MRLKSKPFVANSKSETGTLIGQVVFICSFNTDPDQESTTKKNQKS